jgi:hypothetical protein
MPKNATCKTCAYLVTHDRQESSRSWSVWHECGNKAIRQHGRIDPETFYCAQYTPEPRRPDAA